MYEVTHILNAIDQGDHHAADQLLPLVYDELRKLAAQKMAQERPGQTLQATALVHEAYLRLVGQAPNSTESIAAISLLLRPRPCDGFSSKRPAASRVASMAATLYTQHWDPGAVCLSYCVPIEWFDCLIRVKYRLGAIATDSAANPQQFNEIVA